MSSVVISGDTSGAVTLTVPAVAGTNTITLPAGTGTAAVQGVSTNIVSGTAQASTSGTSIDFTGIPSWVKRVTVMYSGLSTSGTSNILIQVGAGSIQTTGYVSRSTQSSSGTSTAGFIQSYAVLAADVDYGVFTLVTLGSNVWLGNGLMETSGARSYYNVGGVTLSGALDRVRITTANGTDTFDAGTINILYE